MTTSVLSVGGTDLAFDHGDLVLVLRLIARALSDEMPGKEGVEVAIRQALRSEGPGVLDLDLDDLVAEPAGRECTIQAIALARTQLLDWGASIPLSVLRSELRSRGVQFLEPYPTRFLLVALDGLERLVAFNEAR